MLESLNAFNFTIFILFLLLYLYQIIYAGVVLCGKKKPTPEAKQMHRYGVIIAARNEATVIRELLQLSLIHICHASRPESPDHPD